MFAKKINIFKFFLIPVAIVSSISSLIALTSCKENKVKEINYKEEAIKSLKELSEIDIVKLYQNASLSTFAIDILEEDEENGIIKDLLSLLSAKFLISLSFSTHVSVFSELVIILKNLLNKDIKNNEDWLKLNILIKKIDLKTLSAQKITSQKIINITLSTSNILADPGAYGNKKIISEFEFIEKGIGKKIQNSFNSLINGNENSINENTTFNSLNSFLTSSTFKNNHNLLEESKNNILLEFAVIYSDFCYLIKQNKFLCEYSTYLCSELNYEIDCLNEFEKNLTILEASFQNNNNSASEFLEVVLKIDNTCPWLIEQEEGSLNENRKISAIKSFLNSSSFKSKFFSTETLKWEKFSNAIINFLREISIQYVKYNFISKYFLGENKILDFIKKLNFERISIKTLITLIDYTIVVTSNSSKLIGTYVYNRNNVVDEFISAYNKLAKTNKINEDSTFQQVFLNPILIERIHPTFTPYISNINLRGENMNDWSNFIAATFKFFSFNIISIIGGSNCCDQPLSNVGKKINNITDGFSNIDLKNKTFEWLFENIKKTDSYLLLAPCLSNVYQENSIFDIIYINSKAVLWEELFNSLVEVFLEDIEE